MLKDDRLAVRRPDRKGVVAAELRELLGVLAVGVGHVKLQAVAVGVRPHDLLAVRRVGGVNRAEGVGVGGQLLYVRAVGVHDIDAEAVAFAAGSEQDLFAVRRPGGIPSVAVADLFEVTAVSVHQEDAAAVSYGTAEDDLFA